MEFPHAHGLRRWALGRRGGAAIAKGSVAEIDVRLVKPDLTAANSTRAGLANVVYNACSVRVRNDPITVDEVLAGLA